MPLRSQHTAAHATARRLRRRSPSTSAQPIASRTHGTHGVTNVWNRPGWAMSHLYGSASRTAQSVDQIINIADLANFKPILRRGVAQYRELYHAFNEMVKSVQTL